LRRILIADDDPVERSTLINCGKKWGYDVIAAEDGKNAVKHALTFKPELIVMDYILPHLNGLDAAQEIRKIPGLSNTPVILISSFCEKILLEECKKVRNMQFFAKPFELEKLKILIDSSFTP
jgi:CheY-like chemotaxis protein